MPDSFRQEYYPGQAEDTFWIVSLTQPVSVPYGHFDEALLTLEFTRLEPKVIDEKEYVRGVGLVRESAAARTVAAFRIPLQPMGPPSPARGRFRPDPSTRILRGR